uniref:Uncharacterized protein n=1 Tax=Physcomitrium patens TaxID=3218 RepID=A0A2K1JFX9_PHYPA|nr:hypothetical protein PHYPA_017846 [Physcomitrium patens]
MQKLLIGSADSDEPKMRKKGDGCGTMQKKKTMGNGMAEKTTSGSCDEVGNDVKGIAEIFKSNRFGIIDRECLYEIEDGVL